MEEAWSLDIPGLTQQDARRLQEELESQFEFGVLAIDPGVFMVRASDKATVELLRKCLRAGLATEEFTHEDGAGAMSMLEDCEEWLKQAKSGDSLDR